MIHSLPGFAYMTNQLMTLADGKVVLVLEGGYELNALAQCGRVCVETLLGREVRVLGKSLEFEASIDSIIFRHQPFPKKL
jgi:acetoin utilization deacetylase AcuC-like enzyme